jgi:hypothetical protein
VLLIDGVACQRDTTGGIQRVAMQLLRLLPPGTLFNVAVFGSATSWLFPASREFSVSCLPSAAEFLLTAARPVTEASNLWRALEQQRLAAPDARRAPRRCLVVLSDGWVSQPALTLAEAEDLVPRSTQVD